MGDWVGGLVRAGDADWDETTYQSSPPDSGFVKRKAPNIMCGVWG